MYSIEDELQAVNELWDKAKALLIQIGMNCALQGMSEQTLLDIVDVDLTSREPVEPAIVDEIRELLLSSFRRTRERLSK